MATEHNYYVECNNKKQLKSAISQNFSILIKILGNRHVRIIKFLDNCWVQRTGVCQCSEGTNLEAVTSDFALSPPNIRYNSLKYKVHFILLSAIKDLYIRFEWRKRLH